MTGSVDHVFYAVIVFVCIHILSSMPLRAFVVGHVGERVMVTGFSLLSGAAFLRLLLAYAAAPFDAGWTPFPVLKWVPLIIMPLAFILLVTSLTTPNPAMAGGMTVLALAGTPLQDRKKMQIKGALWGPLRHANIRHAVCRCHPDAHGHRMERHWSVAARARNCPHVIFLGGHRHVFGVGPFPW